MSNPSAPLRVESIERCPLCGAPGHELFADLADKLFHVPGKWRIDRCSASECGLAWLNPRPVRDEIPKVYANYYTHSQTGSGRRRSRSNLAKEGYRALAFGDCIVPSGRLAKLAGLLMYMFPTRRAGADYPLRQLGMGKGRRLLELGCGSGENLEILRRAGWDAVGVDIDEAALEVAASRGLNVIEGTIETIALPAESIDAVLMHHVIEHLPDPVGSLTKVYGVLKPGGRLVVATPNLNSLGRRYFREDWRGLEPPRHLCLFTSRSLMAVSRRVGFSRAAAKASVRGSIEVLVASWNLQSGSTVPPPIVVRSILELVWFSEWMGNRLGLELGEELLWVAEK